MCRRFSQHSDPEPIGGSQPRKLSAAIEPALTNRQEMRASRTEAFLHWGLVPYWSNMPGQAPPDDRCRCRLGGG